MQTNTLKRKHPNTKHVQVGRGGKRGKTAGRGTKGQNARSGHRKRPELRDIIKKIPKLRGHGKNRAKSRYEKPVVFPVNLSVLEKNFNAGDTVSPVALLEKGVFTYARLPKAGVKILATGELTKKLHVTKCKVSASAKEKIEAAGGSVE
jgi:large subunit ribosomal protein L15